ncbi:keratinocyte differentiation factor 1 [Austrofundulus limnaeus]|uniref:Keratinocyte differentiation factor 1 n=1 Tax=Austrofundulus limnaeus TaxID=52670 RepID=A0A2I4D7T8_AUSLI|nr:PREDICTED: keratinocyte differentiation factor 1 [Austrofundulus limnaeus]
MPGQSTGTPQTSHHHKPHTYRSNTDKYRQNRTIYRESTAKQDSYKNHHVEHINVHPRYAENKYGHSKGHPRNGTARSSETIGFIPGSADSTPTSRDTCGSCASMGWSSCKALLCCLLTCGFYGSREPCLPVNESSTDHPPKSGSDPPNGTAMSNPTCGIPLESNKPTKTPKLPSNESFRYQDVRFRGEIVKYSVNDPKRSRAPVKGESQRPVSNTSLLSNDYYDVDDPCDSTDVDSLITKKLLELYALHQIEELAKCTSDSSFSRKTNEISELIYSIAQNYNLEEQEAECKLVHGVIRISTRKAKKKASHQSTGHRPNGRSDGTLPDSGNETMTCSSEYPEVKVSEQTPSDELARKMRQYSGRAYSSTAYSPYLHDTGTHSSGAPLLI